MSEEQDQCKIKRWDILKQKLQNISPTQALEWLTTRTDLTIIDCRKPTEYAQIRIPNALHIDYLAYDFWEKISELPLDGQYLVYCNSCRRSTRACTLMMNGGFEHVYNLDGGLNAWGKVLGREGLEG